SLNGLLGLQMIRSRIGMVSPLTWTSGNKGCQSVRSTPDQLPYRYFADPQIVAVEGLTNQVRCRLHMHRLATSGCEKRHPGCVAGLAGIVDGKV
ncbi:MAG: hypothetical protein KDB01_18660, partial [Planctomycetaceae bacterium]|nr:hypothetical protein [Planctomycetaceae bacterium]